MYELRCYNAYSTIIKKYSGPGALVEMNSDIQFYKNNFSEMKFEYSYTKPVEKVG